jgi:hypothetical protein
MVRISPVVYEKIPTELLDATGLMVKYDLPLSVADFLVSIYPTGQDDWSDYAAAKNYLVNELELKDSLLESACKCIVDKLHL